MAQRYHVRLLDLQSRRLPPQSKQAKHLPSLLNHIASASKPTLSCRVTKSSTAHLSEHLAHCAPLLPLFRVPQSQLPLQLLPVVNSSSSLRKLLLLLLLLHAT
jgi:hypothetical protein